MRYLQRVAASVGGGEGLEVMGELVGESGDTWDLKSKRLTLLQGETVPAFGIGWVFCFLFFVFFGLVVSCVCLIVVIVRVFRERDIYIGRCNTF